MNNEMERAVKDINILNQFCTKFCAIIQKHCEYIVVSGFFVIASGRARGTEDIDTIIKKMDKTAFIRMHDDLADNDFVCMQSDDPNEIYDNYLNEKTSVRYTFKNKPLPEMEIKFSKDELDELQLKTKQKFELTGLDVWFSSVDFNIAFKEEYLKSEKDMEDARFLRKVYKDKINENEIISIKKRIRRFRL